MSLNVTKLTVMAFSESKERSIKESIRLSLQLDGFEVGTGGLRSIDGPVSVEEEKSRLLAHLKASMFGRKDVIAKHINDAEDLFNDSKYHAAIAALAAVSVARACPRIISI